MIQEVWSGMTAQGEAVEQNQEKSQVSAAQQKDVSGNVPPKQTTPVCLS